LPNALRFSTTELAEIEGRIASSGERALAIEQEVFGELARCVAEAEAHLIATALHYCKQRNPAYGLGALCLGAEAIVAPLYSDIIEGFMANGVARERLKFFEIHVECDDDHAATMYDILQRLQDQRPQDAALMLEGAQAMIDARLDFFNGILDGAQQACQ
jgi:pyrroloquinoline quinone (PQQ) biosynthesis protein C